MRVLIADDHPLLLEGLAYLLEAHGIEVVGRARDGLEVDQLASWLKPDVILMDIRMPGCSGIAATRRIKAELPQVRIVIFSSSAEEQDVFEAVKSGAYGYLLKSMNADDLITCLKQVERGIAPFSPEIATALLCEFTRLSAAAAGHSAEPEREPRADDLAPDLTRRQREVLTLVAQGLSYKEVGTRLHLSCRTIKYHMGEIMEATHLQNRTQAVAYAARIGLTGAAFDG